MSRKPLAALALPLAFALAGCRGKQAAEWEKYQASYVRFLSEDLKVQAPAAAGIREIRATPTGSVERCVTCHLGVEEPALKDAIVPKPFRFHPDVPHSVKEFGCTICHRGSPADLTVQKAHAVRESSGDSILPLQLTEASCGRCHLERVVPEAPHLSEGRLLIARLGCAGCHEIPGFENEKNTGYDLDGLGSKVTRPWLVQWLANPKGRLPSTTMPAYRFTAEEIESLADFLLGSTNERVESLAAEIRRSAPAIPRAVLLSKGKAAVARLECISCHALDGKGGRVGPDLGKIGDKLRFEWLLAWLKFPREYFPGTRMPQYSFPDQEIVEIAEYLVERFRDTSPPAAAAVPVPSATSSATSIEKGQKLFVSSGCTGCHNRTGITKPQWLAPKLDEIGDKSVADLRFGAAGVERTLYSWLRAKVMSPHIFDPSLRMPDFQLSETEADDITTALLSLSKPNFPEKLVVRPSTARGPHPSGEVAEVFSKYRCLDCHTLREKGQPLAMDLGRVGSKLKREWLVAYLRKPYPIRPLVKERMPPFGITEREAAVLVEFFQTACVDPTLPPSPIAAAGIPKEEIELGRKLYYDEYGCQACHILGAEGGVYGPSLNGVGSRVTPEWIYAWIQNPKALDPYTRTPNYGLSKATALSLTAFLASQRATRAGEVRAEAERHFQLSESPIPEEVKGGRRYEAEKGRSVYFNYCAFCHGERGRGDGPSVERLGLAPTDFTRLDVMAGLKRKDLVRAIREGGKSVGRSPLMPPYDRTLTANQIDEVVTYIQTFIPVTARFKYSEALSRPGRGGGASPCEEMMRERTALVTFLAGAPPDARQGIDRLEAEFERVRRSLTATPVPPSSAGTAEAEGASRVADGCGAFVTHAEEYRKGLTRRLDSLIAKSDLEALNRILAASGKTPLPLPPTGRTYGETADAYRRFNEQVQARGRAAFAGKQISWEAWKAVYANLRTGFFAPEHRAYLDELERMGLVSVRVEIRG